MTFLTYFAIYLLLNVFVGYGMAVYGETGDRRTAWPYAVPNRWTAPFWQVRGFYYDQQQEPPGWRSRKPDIRWVLVLLFLGTPIVLILCAYDLLNKVYKW